MLQLVNDLNQCEHLVRTNQTPNNAEWNIKDWDSLGFPFLL